MAPSLDYNLFSIQLALTAGFDVSKSGKGLVLKQGTTTLPFTTIKKKGPSYLMYGQISPRDQEGAQALQETCNAGQEMKEEKMDYAKVHRKCMHCSYELTESTAKSMGLKLSNKPEKCVARTLVKRKVKPTAKINKNRFKIPE